MAVIEGRLEQPKFIPGYEKDCGDCSKYGPSFVAPGYNCREVRLEHDGRTPIITKGLDKNGPELTGERKTCWGFELNIAASVRELTTTVRMTVNRIGLSFPPF